MAGTCVRNASAHSHMDGALPERKTKKGPYSTKIRDMCGYWGQRSTTQKQMWRRKKPIQPSETESKQESNGVCMNCIKLLQENSQLKEQLAVLQGEGKRKQYTIAPTLYTFYKNNVQKNRISR